MQTKNYQIKRNSVYAGKVVKIIKIEEQKIEHLSTGRLYLSSYVTCRSILFTISNNGLADDLLYQSPNYPIINFSPKELSLTSSIAVINKQSLTELLEYFHYPENLSFYHIKNIRNRFFNGKWGYNHPEFFGLEKNDPTICQIFKNGVQLMNAKKIGLSLNLDKSNIPDQQLSDETINILNNLSDTILPFQKIDAFKPHKEEGKIKKLTIF